MYCVLFYIQLAVQHFKILFKYNICHIVVLIHYYLILCSEYIILLYWYQSKTIDGDVYIVCINFLKCFPNVINK